MAQERKVLRKIETTRINDMFIDVREVIDPRLRAAASSRNKAYAKPFEGVQSMPLTFQALREANIQRGPLFKNSKGEVKDCSDWMLSAWSNATLGELGEAANIIKKIERGDFTLEEAKQKLADELADTVCYLDKLAIAAGINLGDAVVQKFNQVSMRIGVDVFLPTCIECPLEPKEPEFQHTGD